MASKPQERDEKLPATVAQQVPAHLIEAANEDAGKGVSTKPADAIVPLIVVLQPLSPQVDETNAAYIQGAKAGTVWLRNANRPLIPGDEGILFQHCYFDKSWPEWVPRDRGGGFVARHKNREATADDMKRLKGRVEMNEDIPDVEDADFRIDQSTKQKIWFRPNGNDLVLTRSHAGFVIFNEHEVLPYVIPFKGAGHATSRSWMFNMMNLRTPDGSKILAAWSRLYRLKTRQRQNTKGRWFQFEVEAAGYVDVEGYRRGKALNAALETGEKVFEDEGELSRSGEDLAGAARQPGGGGGQTGGKVDDEIPY